MMKIILIGILYNLLLQNNAAGEPTVKAQICSDIFSNAINKCLNQIEEDELKKCIPGIVTQIPVYNFGLFRLRRPMMIPNPMPTTSIQLNYLNGTKILSVNSIEITFDGIIEFGKKPSSNDGTSQNSNNYLFLHLDMKANLNLETTGETFNFILQNLEVSLRNNVTEQMPYLDSDAVAPAFQRNMPCIIDKLIEKLNIKWKGYMSNDPSGITKMMLTDTDYNGNCIEYTLNCSVDNNEVTSTQRHDTLSGSAVSTQKHYLATRISYDVSTAVENSLAQMDLLVSPEQCKTIVPGANISDSSTVKGHILEHTMNDECDKMTLSIAWDGFDPESDKCIWHAECVEVMNVAYKLENEKVMANFFLAGDPVIRVAKSHIENSDIDLEGLQTFIQEFTDKGLMRCLSTFQIDCRIPFAKLASQPIVVTPETIVIPLSPP